jgi:putative SOS response-associated peptidase YedK
MCGRYRLSRHKQLLAEYFGMDFDSLEWHPRYNIAPAQPVPVVTQAGGERKASLMRWGLIPSWAADRSGAARTINARAETAAAKPSFREPLRKRRCLIPADGFYEWQRSGQAKQPFCFELGDGAIFAFAGLWDRWRAPDGQVLESCTVLTTAANRVMEGIHDRMPVILTRPNYERWLDPAMQNLQDAAALLAPYEADAMKRYAVSARVNQVANDGPECCEPAEPGPVTLRLFE